MPPLIILTATKAEAAPLINHFKLQKSELRKNYYHNDTIVLVVMGIGKQAAYQTVQRVLIEEPALLAMVNIGIAAAKALAVGRLIWPCRISAFDVNAALPKRQTSTLQVRSVDAPTQPTEPGVIYDMEAEGICEALALNASHIKLFCAKVISDNQRHSHQRLSPQCATALIRRHLVEFEQMFDLLLLSTAKN